MSTAEGDASRLEREQKRSPIDVHVGARVRQQRMLVGMTLEELGVALGIAYQQVQKYERGLNHITPHRLMDIAHALEVPVSFFFQDAPGGLIAPDQAQGDEESHTEFSGDARELLDIYFSITNPDVRKGLLGLARTLAEAEWDRGADEQPANLLDARGKGQKERKRSRRKTQSSNSSGSGP